MQSSIKDIIRQGAVAHLERKIQERLQLLEAIAKAAEKVAQDPNIEAISGGRELISAVKDSKRSH